MPDKNRNTPIEDVEEIDVAASLDQRQHAEACILYQESTETLRFVKNHQWKTVGATLLADLGLVIIAVMTRADDTLRAQLMGIAIVLTCAVVFTLILYQFWMHNEILKITAIDARLSSFFQGVRALKSQFEGNFHRYLLLGFMIVVVLMGGLVVHLALARLGALNI